MRRCPRWRGVQAAPIAVSVGLLLIVMACGTAAPAAPTPATTSAALANTPAVAAGGTPLTTFVTPVPPTAVPVAAPMLTPGTRPGGTLHLALPSEPDALDPAKTIQLFADSINTHLYERLVYIGQDRQPHPWLAEKWDISPDGKQITFTLRQGLKFHDGTDLDAAAVKFDFDRILDPATGAPAKAQLGTLQSVDALDPRTVRFNFSEAYAPFFTNISLSYGGIVSPTAVQKFGDAFGHNPVGSGPFRFKSWEAGQKLTLERNPDYKNVRDDEQNKGAPYVDALEWRFIPEAPTRLAALQSGELDVSDVDFQQAPTVQRNSNLQLIVWKDALDMDFIEFANKEPFTDPAVRKAIAYAIDRDTIVKTAWNGYATPNLNPIPAGVAGWDASTGQQYGYAYDLSKAQQALTNGGWSPGPDGVMQKDGKSLEFSLLVFSDNEAARTASELIQSSLNSIGVKVDIQLMEFGSELPLLKAGNFDADWMRWTWPDPVIETLLWKSPGWTNQMNDPQLDQLAAAADGQLNPAKRLEAVKAIQIYVLKNAYVAPVATDWILQAATARVKGYKWDAVGYPTLIDVSLAP